MHNSQREDTLFILWKLFHLTILRYILTICSMHILCALVKVCFEYLLFSVDITQDICSE